MLGMSLDFFFKNDDKIKSLKCSAYATDEPNCYMPKHRVNVTKLFKTYSNLLKKKLLQVRGTALI
jgi:hypothetical protein